MSTYEILEKALALIESEENWCQFVPRNGDKFCGIGAINYVVTGVSGASWGGREIAESRGIFPAYVSAVECLEKLAQEQGYERDPGRKCALAQFNNHRSHAEVVSLFQRAIRSEKAKAEILIPTQPEKVPA